MENIVFIFIFIIVLALIALFLADMVKIVPQARAMVIERLGTYHATWETGIHIKASIY